MIEAGPRFEVVALGSVGSTNDEAHALARQGAADRTAVTAEEQLGGRGRRGRAWASPPGNLYLSAILRPSCPAGQAAQLSFIAALAVRDLVRRFLPNSVPVAVKWPNDVLVDGLKISGILLETGPVSGGDVEYVILGMGINLAHYPTDSERPATSLAAQGADPGVLAARDTLLQALGHWDSQWRTQGFPAIREAWLRDAIGLGAPIQVRLPDSTLEGVFADLDRDGALLLQQPDGRRRITAGDVFLAR
ncbi:biotin--[acetyl-CoA-carboxylase] ligase [Oceanibaculum indicum]|uniref:biotin--[biotin carboxyl-carrier protein] ligase n=1 Tax=Oceanibaculum indicum TaxID=526216 RepID=A0A420WQQ9_9PROT|nr:biotin--[acetyl-CoA-carboxylase] ligase [Oceanibaculum indicum]RKQ73235.1 BirA family biotin operon repressor/biotin-[acetyl-CoA-carboxylase] ligase [Oceanibaculum indicum]